MDLKLEMFNPETHYDLVKNWWEKQSWPVIPLTHLPQLGIVVYCDDTPACAGWVYQTDSAFCWFEWIVANPEIRKEKRAESLNALIQEATNAAQKMGYQTIMMSAKNESLISRLSKHGFSATDNGMKTLIKNIQGGI